MELKDLADSQRLPDGATRPPRRPEVDAKCIPGRIESECQSFTIPEIARPECLPPRDGRPRAMAHATLDSLLTKLVIGARPRLPVWRATGDACWSDSL
ncbi:MAG: hypothetical protein WAN86_08790 [Hyphomicrobiaceae bacterium]